MLRTEIISKFLIVKSRPDLAALYNHDMECQVNVAKDNGERVDGDYKGVKWVGWSDGVQTWKAFRIPYKANSEPEYTDTELHFDLNEHAESIGMTGWDWKNRLSRWVGFDFDAITGHSDKHSKKLSTDELNKIVEAVKEIPWVTVRKSTSGRGIHLYVYLNPVSTNNHTEHAALARAILGQISALTCCNFQNKVDACGGNMWVWHRKMEGTDGLSLIKAGTRLEEPPTNWRDHLNVVKGIRKKALPKHVEESQEKQDVFEALVCQTSCINLDESHKKLIKYILEEVNGGGWWDDDHHMLVTHTHDLKVAHETFGLKGIFETFATGKDQNDINCYAFPMVNGGWTIRRFTPGVGEAASWDQDGQGWTKCYYNVEPDLAAAAKINKGVEDTKRGFTFPTGTEAANAIKALGATFELPDLFYLRKTKIQEHRDGRLIVTVDGKKDDKAVEGWLSEKGKWVKLVPYKISPMRQQATLDANNYDDLVRHLMTPQNEEYGWMLSKKDGWDFHSYNSVRLALKSMNFSNKELENVLGNSIMKCWRLCNRPFQPEYPGDRMWNRNAAQLKFIPTQETDSLSYPTWTKLLDHWGKSLDDSIACDPWCQKNGIKTGADYLKLWIASIFNEPTQPLPYLFLYGPQNSGKSFFHEVLSLLMTRGCADAKLALMSEGNFNGELLNEILCYTEEIDLRRNKEAANRIKEWVTATTLSIHPKGGTPYPVPNCTHWVQMANDRNYCPIFPGDTRIVMIYVEALENREPKNILVENLEKEAPDFLAELLHLDIPESGDRLNIPVITTLDKIQSEESNETALEHFIKEKLFMVPGEIITVKELYDEFVKYLMVNAPEEIVYWTKIRVGRSVPPTMPKGRIMSTLQWGYGNVSLKPQEGEPKIKLKAWRKEGTGDIYLVKEKDE